MIYRSSTVNKRSIVYYEKTMFFRTSNNMKFSFFFFFFFFFFDKNPTTIEVQKGQFIHSPHQLQLKYDKNEKKK
jgi:hypothetical protein